MSTRWQRPLRSDELLHAGIVPIKPIGGIGNRVREWKNHKYLKKIGNRYFYTQEQLSAYMRGGQKAIGNAANRAKSAAGKVANKALNTQLRGARTVYKRDPKTGMYKYSHKEGPVTGRSLLNGANRAMNSARRAASNRLGQAGKSIYDAAGGSAKRNLARARRDASAAGTHMRNMQRAANRADKNYNYYTGLVKRNPWNANTQRLYKNRPNKNHLEVLREANQKYNQAHDLAYKKRRAVDEATRRYSKTLLGRTDAATAMAKRLRRTATNQAKQAGYRAGHTAKRLVNSIKPKKATRYVSSYANREVNGRRQDRVRKNLDAARNSATNAARSLAKAPSAVRRNVNANSRINSTVSRQYSSAKKVASKQLNRANKAINRAASSVNKRAVNYLRDMYGRSPAAKRRARQANRNSRRR